MIRRIVEIIVALAILGYVIHNPAGTAHAIKGVATGIGNFVTALAG